MSVVVAQFLLVDDRWQFVDEIYCDRLKSAIDGSKEAELYCRDDDDGDDGCGGSLSPLSCAEVEIG